MAENKKYCPVCQKEFTDKLTYCPYDATALILRQIAGLAAGTVVAGRYRLLQEIGGGGMGMVYKAMDTRLDKIVALKILKPELISDPKSIERFRREARAAANLSHPNVVTVTDNDVSLDSGIAYIAMEFLQGGDLRKKIDKEGMLSFEDTAAILLQTCSALQAAHAKEIVHRDLKPDNIWLVASENGSEEVKVLDFGIAKAKLGPDKKENFTLTEIGMVVGTPHYMSPEQCMGEADIDARSDIYSLGVILYEMLTGKVPFSAATPQGVLVRHSTEMPKAPTGLRTDLPHELEQVVLRSLAKKREERHQTAAELALDMMDAMAAAGINIEYEMRRTLQPFERSTAMLSNQMRRAAMDKSGQIPGQDRVPSKTDLSKDRAPTGPTTRQGAQSGQMDVKRPHLESGQTVIIGGGQRAGGSGAVAPVVGPVRADDVTVASGKFVAGSQSSQSVALLMPPSGTIFGLPKAVIIALAAMIVLVVASVGVYVMMNVVPGVPPITPPIVETVPAGMVAFDGGNFSMGPSHTSDVVFEPSHNVSVNKFYLDKNLVTVGEYDDVVRSGRIAPPQSWRNGKAPGPSTAPITDITWDEAKKYATAVSKRLPTEAEWEFAARSDNSRQLKDFNFRDRYEWTETDYTPYSGTANADSTPGYKVIRGDNDSAKRRKKFPTKSGSDVGFRCANN